MNSGIPIKLKVAIAEDGLSLVQFLSRRLSISRNKAKEIIDRRCVFVNGRRVWMARHRLESGDQITGSFSVEKPADIKSATILHEDRDYLVINKPAGISSNGPDSVEQSLNRQSGDDPATAGGVGQTRGKAPRMACHRLDKDTSGCLIFAKSAEAKEKIIPLFARNEVSKKYEAVVRGRLPKETMTLTTPIDGQKAITHVRLLNATPFASHVLISIETGRTHQIRKHLASIGHPVLGDQCYGTGREVPQSERSIGRQMLHAMEIKFIQPFSGMPVHGKAPLPEDIKDCLRQYHLK